MIYALDTNCILRWMLWDLEPQAKKVDELLRSSAQPLHIADCALLEACYVMKKILDYSEEEIEKGLRLVLKNPKINCNRLLFTKMLDELAKSPKVSFVDIYLNFCAQLTGAQALVTFDKTLHKRFPTTTKLL